MRRYIVFMDWNDVWWKEKAKTRAQGKERALEEGQAALRKALSARASYMFQLGTEWMEHGISFKDRLWF